MKKFLRSALCGALAVAVLAACAPAEEAVSSASTLQSQSEAGESASMIANQTTLTDMNGREVVLDSTIERVIALAPSDAEIIYALGAGDKLIGRGEYCDYPEAVLDVPVVQTGSETNIEEILALEPQLVVMNTMAQPMEDIDQLENAGIPVLTTASVDIAGVYESIEMLGVALEAQEQADTLISDMQADFDTLVQTVGEQSESKTIYFEVSPLEFGLWTAGNNTFMNEIATLLGLENAFSDVEGWAEISEEQVLERNPDAIVTIAMYFGEGPLPDEEILSRNGWQQLSAVQNAQVFSLPEDELSRPGPRLVEGAQALAQAVYGIPAEADETQAASEESELVSSSTSTS